MGRVAGRAAPRSTVAFQKAQIECQTVRLQKQVANRVEGCSKAALDRTLDPVFVEDVSGAELGADGAADSAHTAPAPATAATLPKRIIKVTRTQQTAAPKNPEEVAQIPQNHCAMHLIGIQACRPLHPPLYLSETADNSYYQDERLKYRVHLS